MLSFEHLLTSPKSVCELVDLDVHRFCQCATNWRRWELEHPDTEAKATQAHPHPHGLHFTPRLRALALDGDRETFLFIYLPAFRFVESFMKCRNYLRRGFSNCEARLGNVCVLVWNAWRCLVQFNARNHRNWDKNGDIYSVTFYNLMNNALSESLLEEPEPS